MISGSRDVHMFRRLVLQRLAEEPSWREGLHGSVSLAEKNVNITSWSEYPMESEDHNIFMTSFSLAPLIKNTFKIIAFREGETGTWSYLEKKKKVGQCLEML